MTITAPQSIPPDLGISVFLAGTIDNGNSHNWQQDVIDRHNTIEFKHITWLNPRRPDWNTKLKPVWGNKAFMQQVRWERKGLLCANYIIFNFLPGSLSPISLMELGTMCNYTGIFVCCSKKYFRSGNVWFLCKEYEIPVFETMPSLLKALHLNIKKNRKNNIF